MPSWCSGSISRWRSCPSYAVTVLVATTVIAIGARVYFQLHIARDDVDWGQEPWFLKDNNGSKKSNGSRKTHHRKLLFVGNSYTEYNDLAGLTQQIFQSQQKAQVIVQSHHPGGETFRGHYGSTQQDDEDQSSLAGGHHHSSSQTIVTNELRQWLVTDPPKWNWVIFQEQSEVPGFWDDPIRVPVEYSYNTSIYSCEQLNHLVEKIDGAQTLFFLTWGRRDGDAFDPSLYPDYLTMQQRLNTGYRQYRQATSTKERPTFIAPVGLVFETIYKDLLLDQGTDPSSEGTLFFQLYDVDGSHPSLAGSYLAALTIFATIMGDDPRAVSWYPPDLEENIAAEIKMAVAKTILETASSGSVDYPWQPSMEPSETNDTMIP